MKVLDDYIYIGRLLDFYGSLLTESESKSVDYYYNEDYSLTEIAELLSISRQAVSLNIKRAIDKLKSFEDALKLIEKFEKKKEHKEKLEIIFKGLSSCDDIDEIKGRIKEAEEIIKEM